LKSVESGYATELGLTHGFNTEDESLIITAKIFNPLKLNAEFKMTFKWIKDDTVVMSTSAGGLCLEPGENGMLIASIGQLLDWDPEIEMEALACPYKSVEHPNVELLEDYSDKIWTIDPLNPETPIIQAKALRVGVGSDYGIYMWRASGSLGGEISYWVTVL